MAQWLREALSQKFLWRSASSVSSELISFNCFQLHSWLLMSAVCQNIYDENNAEFQLDVVIYSKWKFYERKCSITAGCAFISTFWLSTMIQSIHGSVVTASMILFSFLASKNVNFGRFAKVSCRTDSPEGPVWSFWSATRLPSRRMDELFRRICLFNHGIKLNKLCLPA